MQDFLNKKIILGITGGIAAYKSAQLVRDLTQLGACVRVVMTDAAEAFVTPTTLQALSGQEVRRSLWDSSAERAMSHIELARWADYVVIAPATADCLAKMAHGLADDLLSTLYLVTEKPVIVCPAMNRSMWQHPATKANMLTLKQRNVIVVGPQMGAQACGEYGMGRMSEPADIIDALRLCDIHHLLVGQKLLITAGPTQEPVDPVRYLSNHSSGKMGYALAKAAVMAGADVTLISGPTKLPVPNQVDFYAVQTAEEMSCAVMDHLKPSMLVIACAAVADYTVEIPAEQKIKKHMQTELVLTLKKTPDILTQIVSSQRAAYIVGFAAETDNLTQHARMKLESKRLNMIVANQVGNGQGFDQEDNQVTVLTAKHEYTYECMHKVRLAGHLIALLQREALSN